MKRPDQSSLPDSNFGASQLTRLNRLLPYYLDCIYEDGNPGASYFLSDEGRKFLVPPINKEWNHAGQAKLSIPLSRETSDFAKILRQQRGTSTLFYGYPLYVRWIEKSPKGWTGGFALPILLQPLEFQVLGSSIDCRLSSEHVRVNGEFLDQLFRTKEEKRVFLRDIGLIDLEGDSPPPDMGKLIANLAKSNIAEVKEPIAPENIPSTPRIASFSGAGIYNRAVIMIGERPKFTSGLERELNWFF